MTARESLTEVATWPDGDAPLLPTRLEPLAGVARDYARAATSKNTARAYNADWRDYLRWRSRQGLEARPLTDPEAIGLYVAAMAFGEPRAGGKARSVATIERRLSALAWNFTQRGLPFDRHDRHIATVLAGVRRTHGRPPKGKEALLSEHMKAMLDALPPSNLRNIRDRAILLLGFAGGLRRSEIVGLDCRAEDSLEGSGWPEFQQGGVLLTLRGKTGWREVEIGYGSSEATCPVVALKAWMNFSRVAHGPLFRRIVGREIGAERSERPPCGAARQAPCDGLWAARRPFGEGPSGEVFRSFAARWARLVGLSSTSVTCKNSLATLPLR